MIFQFKRVWVEAFGFYIKRKDLSVAQEASWWQEFRAWLTDGRNETPKVRKVLWAGEIEGGDQELQLLPPIFGWIRSKFRSRSQPWVGTQMNSALGQINVTQVWALFVEAMLLLDRRRILGPKRYKFESSELWFNFFLRAI